MLTHAAPLRAGLLPPGPAGLLRAGTQRQPGPRLREGAASGGGSTLGASPSGGGRAESRSSQIRTTPPARLRAPSGAGPRVPAPLVYYRPSAARSILGAVVLPRPSWQEMAAAKTTAPGMPLRPQGEVLANRGAVCA